jgi:hypothetical protein
LPSAPALAVPITATIVGGLLACGNVDRVVVAMPAC